MLSVVRNLLANPRAIFVLYKVRFTVIMALVYHLQRSPGCKCSACVRASTFAKIGFVFLPFRKVRLTANTTDEIDEDPTGTKAFWDRGLLNGAPQKVRSIFLSKMFIFLFLCLFQSIISSVLTL